MMIGGSFFDADERAERRAAAEENAAAIARADQAAEEEKAARVAELGKRANAFFLKKSYDDVGVDPPFVDAAGVPTCSLYFLLAIGWRVEEVSGKMVLTQGASGR